MKAFAVISVICRLKPIKAVFNFMLSKGRSRSCPFVAGHRSSFGSLSLESELGIDIERSGRRDSCLEVAVFLAACLLERRLHGSYSHQQLGVDQWVEDHRSFCHHAKRALG